MRHPSPSLSPSCCLLPCLLSLLILPLVLGEAAVAPPLRASNMSSVEEPEHLSRNELKRWLREVTERGKLQLRREQRFSNFKFVQRQDPAHASLLQIGANAHDIASFRSTPATLDVGPECVKRGWHAILMEPMPSIFAQLAARYANKTLVKTANMQSGERLTLVRGVVCDNCLSAPSIRMWYVNTKTNVTGTWGSEHADTRCLSAQHGPSAILGEIASLSRSHLLKHEAYFKSSRRTCTRCSERVGRPVDRQLPANCLAHVVSRNLQSTQVACYCPAHLLPTVPPAAYQRGADVQIVPGARVRGTALASLTSLTLLLIDAEGYDAIILRQFPFEHVRVSRITFEAQHLPDRVFHATGELLRSHGFELVYGGFKSALSTWHHVNSTD